MIIELCLRSNGGVGRLHKIQLLTVESDRVASNDVDRKVNNTRTADPTDPTLIEPV